MQEMKIDISGHIPASLYQYRNTHFDYVVTLCDNVRTTAQDVLQGGDRFFHRNFVTPQEIGKTHEEILPEYRKLRDEIGVWLSEIFPIETPNQDNSNGGKIPDRTMIPLAVGLGTL